MVLKTNIFMLVYHTYSHNNILNVLNIQKSCVCPEEVLQEASGFASELHSCLSEAVFDS